MKTSLSILLLLFTSSVIAVGADRISFRDAKPDLDASEVTHFHVGLLDSTIDPNKRTSPLDESSPLKEKQYDNCTPENDLYLSASEKFDSSFCETMVLHLVSQTHSKARQDFQVAKFSGSPSLRRLNIMLQV